MAKKKGLLGSGSKGRTSASTGGKLPDLSIPDMPADQPWVNPSVYEAQTRAGQAGNMLRAVLSKSKSTGIKV
jgi:hypothetical protein